MTDTGLSFYKYNDSTSQSSAITNAKNVEGNLVFIYDKHELWAGSETNPQLILKGCSNVTFNNNILTIETLNGTATSIDFSDIASASSTVKVLKSVFDLMGATASGSSRILDYSQTNYLGNATTLVSADKILDDKIKTKKADVESKDATIKVNDNNLTTIANVDGVDIKTKSVILWDEWG